MFDRCGHWSSLLSRRADGALSPKDWGALQDHIASCARCRHMVEADDALHDVMGVYTPQFSPDSASAFDENIVCALTRRPIRVPHFALLTTYWRQAVVYLRSLPLNLFGQVGGGAAVAMCLTSFFLIPALHPNSAARSAHNAEQIAARLTEKNSESAVLPVSIESLLNVPSPRAAMLWTAPEERKSPRSHSGLPVADPTVLPSYSNYSTPAHSHSTQSPAKPERSNFKTTPTAPLKHSSLLNKDINKDINNYIAEAVG